MTICMLVFPFCSFRGDVWFDCYMTSSLLASHFEWAGVPFVAQYFPIYFVGSGEDVCFG